MKLWRQLQSCTKAKKNLTKYDALKLITIMAISIIFLKSFEMLQESFISFQESKFILLKLKFNFMLSSNWWQCCFSMFWHFERNSLTSQYEYKCTL